MTGAPQSDQSERQHRDKHAERLGRCCRGRDDQTHAERPEQMPADGFRHRALEQEQVPDHHVVAATAPHHRGTQRVEPHSQRPEEEGDGNEDRDVVERVDAERGRHGRCREDHVCSPRGQQNAAAGQLGPRDVGHARERIGHSRGFPGSATRQRERSAGERVERAEVTGRERCEPGDQGVVRELFDGPVAGGGADATAQLVVEQQRFERIADGNDVVADRRRIRSRRRSPPRATRRSDLRSTRHQLAAASTNTMPNPSTSRPPQRSRHSIANTSAARVQRRQVGVGHATEEPHALVRARSRALALRGAVDRVPHRRSRAARRRRPRRWRR